MIFCPSTKYTPERDRGSVGRSVGFAAASCGASRVRALAYSTPLSVTIYQLLPEFVLLLPLLVLHICNCPVEPTKVKLSLKSTTTIKKKKNNTNNKIASIIL